MPGPAPKNPIIRQRRNRVATNSTLDVDADARKRIPSLPKMKGKKWHRLTIAWWTDVWHSPMAAEFLLADKHALFRLAVLIDEFWSMPTKDMASEIRLEQQAFGLTPIDRRRLQWSMNNGAKRESERRSFAAPQVHENASDPRKMLEWVVAEE